MNSVLVTGANGEMGHALLPELKKKGMQVVALDIAKLDPDLSGFVTAFFEASVLDKLLLTKLFNKYNFDTIFHLGALLSTAAEKDPELAQTVNAGGTSILLSVANLNSIKTNKPVKFLFPSTIAVYGLPDLKTKTENSDISEEEFLDPITMYGITKLYSEKLGKYYSYNYKMLDTNANHLIDFRAIRFPGIISAVTVPSGGTSDYGPEMIHTAAQGKSYESFVREDTVLPFIVMPDAVKAIIQLSEAPKEKLSRDVYNISAFSISAKEIADLVLKVFPNTTISYNPHPARQKIVDSWPGAVDDSLARRDWAWKPDYDIKKAFEEYLIPEIQNKYSK